MLVMLNITHMQKARLDQITITVASSKIIKPQICSLSAFINGVQWEYNPTHCTCPMDFVFQRQNLQCAAKILLCL